MVAFAAAQEAGGKKLALIVAIGEYPIETGYTPLHAGNDIPLVRTALQTQGFDPALIRVIQDDKADREGIVAGLTWLAQTAGPGDDVVFHYSGHGHQISDDGRDEPDGLDEVLVPYGAPSMVQKGSPYRGELHLRDDELGRLLGAIRIKVGARGSVAVFLDACYSGSGTRGLPDGPAVRGMATPLLLGPTPPAGRGTDVGSGAFDPAPRDPPAGGAFVVLSAARHNQAAFETTGPGDRPVGSLSLALSRALPRLRHGPTYRALFDEVALQMSAMELYDQRPQIEGSVDAEVFTGRIVEQRPYYQVARLEGDSIARIRGGTILGIVRGTRMDIHPIGTTDPKQSAALARGMVRSADPGEAVLALEPGPPGRALAGGLAFVTEYGAPEDPITVRVDPRLPAQVQTTIREIVGQIPAARLGTVRPDVVVAPGAGSAIRLLNPADGLVQWTSTAGEAWDGGLKDRLVGMARMRALLRMELHDPGIRFRMELVRIQPRARKDDPCDPSVPFAVLPTSPPTSQGIVLHPGDYYTLRIINEGKQPAYVTVLSLAPGGIISQYWPPPGNRGADNFLEPGTNFLAEESCMWADPTPGVEVLKLFATTERLDFQPILSGTATRAGQHSPLGRLLADTYHGLRGEPVPAAGWGSTTALSLLITPKPR